ncbi:MAG: PaaI family thioesterase [Flavobacteriaceae bacterium]|nr:PaaI family thioesterase [Flavobacteriaceae bacterium]
MDNTLKFSLLKQAFENKMPANKYLGLKILELKAGYAKIHIPFKDEFIGDFMQKRWHGGIQASIADSAGGIVALTAMNNIGDKVSTIDIRVDYLNGSEPVDLFAEAEIIKNGKRIIKVDVKLYHKKERIIAIARCAFSILRNKE